VYQAHYCGEEIVEEHVGFTFNDISCGMSDDVSQACDNGTESINKSNCCKNVSSYNKLESKRDFYSLDVNLIKTKVSSIYNVEVYNLYVQNIPVQLKSKPPPERDWNNNLSNILPQAQYLAFIQSYLC
jgi:hypothetical protein